MDPVRVPELTLPEKINLEETTLLKSYQVLLHRGLKVISIESHVNLWGHANNINITVDNRGLLITKHGSENHGVIIIAETMASSTWLADHMGIFLSLKRLKSSLCDSPSPTTGPQSPPSSVSHEAMIVRTSVTV